MTTPELIQAFYKRYEKMYPGISFEEMKLIVTTPFDVFKETMETGELEDVRLQYLFVAKVSPARVLKHLRSLYTNKEKGNISDKAFDRYHRLFVSYIDRYPSRFKKYQSKIKEITQC